MVARAGGQPHRTVLMYSVGVDERLLVDAADALQVADMGRVISAARHRGSALKPVRFVSHLPGMRGTRAPVAILRNV